MSAWLEAQWTELCRRLGANEAVRPRWESVRRAYSESHRHYHTLQHVEHCLREFGRARDLAQDANAAETALWFHDIRYDTHASDNEEQSAREAEAFLNGCGAADEFRRRVVALILDTKHTSPPTTPDGALVVDADLSILGQEAARHAEFERQVRDEYRWVPGFIFRRKRRAILQAFLARPHIFTTPFFRDRYEENARRNLAWSLSLL
jgi:predicted metal-dependent HD superfamily phosphohydrolase